MVMEMIDYSTPKALCDNSWCRLPSDDHRLGTLGLCEPPDLQAWRGRRDRSSDPRRTISDRPHPRLPWECTRRSHRRGPLEPRRGERWRSASKHASTPRHSRSV